MPLELKQLKVTADEYICTFKTELIAKNVKVALRVGSTGRILVSKKAWMVRFTMLIAVSGLIGYNLYVGLNNSDYYVLFITILPLHMLTYSVCGWIMYRNPSSKGTAGNDLVTVIVPIYNQKSIIESVIDGIFESTYKNIEVVAVNDGSTDGTKEILDNLKIVYPELRVIHKENEGKRRAVAAAFYASKGEYLIMIDSDSLIDKHAITEFMKMFNANPKAGAAVGYAKVWNNDVNVLTKCQDVWYDFSFLVRKAAESYFGNVMCLSGCLAAYRRDAIKGFIPFWINARLRDSEDRELTTWVVSDPKMKNWYLKKSDAKEFSKAHSFTQFDDAEDRALSAAALREWKTLLVATAVVYTDVPETFRKFIKQQIRWKRGTCRVNFYVAKFFWRKNPLMAFVLFYTDFYLTLFAPAIIILSAVYFPLVHHSNWSFFAFLGGAMLASFVHGVDCRFRDPNQKHWHYKPLMNILTGFILSFLIIWAAIKFYENNWGTR